MFGSPAGQPSAVAIVQKRVGFLPGTQIALLGQLVQLQAAPSDW